MSPVLSPKQTQTEQQANVEVIRCGLGEEIYCLEMSEVASVMPVGDLQLCGEWDDDDAVGLMEFKGRHIPVYDLAKRLNLPAKPAQRGHYIVLIKHPLCPFGLRVDSVSRVIRLDPENVLPLPKPMEHTRDLFRGIVDFTRDRRANADWRTNRYLPGISELRETPANRRNEYNQMQLLLNPRRLLDKHLAKPAPPLPAESLLRRYASVTAAAQPRSSRQLVVFPIGVTGDCPLLMGLSISQVAEITEPLPTSSIPEANQTVTGFAQWRNCPVPVLNLQATLDCRADSETSSHWIVARDHQTRELVALPVLGRIQSLRLPIDYRPCELPVKSWSQFARGCYEFEACVLILPRLDALSEFSGEC